MKSRETLIRLKKFQVDEKRRKVAQIESMIAEFERMAADLEREIKTEQDRAGIHDPAHFAYPTYAKAAMARRDNLKRSADELKVQLEDAQRRSAEAFEELKKVELLDERDQMRERAADNVARAGRARSHRHDARRGRHPHLIRTLPGSRVARIREPARVVPGASAPRCAHPRNGCISPCCPGHRCGAGLGTGRARHPGC